jgi:hypothetical protein
LDVLLKYSRGNRGQRVGPDRNKLKDSFFRAGPREDNEPDKGSVGIKESEFLDECMVRVPFVDGVQNYYQRVRKIELEEGITYKIFELSLQCCTVALVNRFFDIGSRAGVKLPELVGDELDDS